MIIEELFDFLGHSSLLPLGALIFLLLWLSSEVGFRFGRYSERRRVHPEREVSGIGTVIAGRFALLAFTLGLAIASARHQARIR